MSRGDSARVLLIGLGNRGNMWADVIEAGGRARVKLAVDPADSGRERLHARHPQIAVVRTLEEALAAGSFDLAVLVTPPDGHLRQSRAILAAGLPLLAEKPLTLDLDESIEIVRLAAEAQLPLTVGLNFRFLPVTLAYRDLIAGGSLGRPDCALFEYLRNRNGFRPGLNRYPLSMRHPMMLEQTIHHLDLIRFVYAAEVERIACRTWNPPWSMYAHDANVACLLTLSNGMEVSYFGTWSGGWNEGKFQWRTDCQKGVVIQRELFEDLAFARTEDPGLTPVPIAEARAFYDDTAALLDAFLDALESGAQAPCDGADHLRTLALCWAGIEASETGRVIDVPAWSRARGVAE